MEITLHQTAVDCYEKVCAQRIRKEETQDSVVPDTLPDIGNILGVTGNALIRSKEVSAGRVRLEANVPAIVCYAPEEGGAPERLEVNLPLFVSLEDEAIPDGGLCVADLKLAALEARLVNPRKVSVRAELVFAADCYAPSQLRFTGVPEHTDEEINVCERTLAVTPVGAVTEKTFVLNDEFALPASVASARLLGQTAEAQTEELKTSGNKLLVRGRVKSNLLYLSEDGTVGAVEFSTGFTQLIEAESLPEDYFTEVRLLLSGIFYDLPEGQNTGEAELHLVAQLVAYGQVEAKCITDAYSNRNELHLTTEPLEKRRICRTLGLRETLRALVETEPGTMELLQGFCTAGLPVMENPSEAELPLSVFLCYRSADGKLHTLRRNFPLRFSAGLPEGEELLPVEARAQELLLTPTAGGLELRANVELSAFVAETETLRCVTGMELDEEAVLDFSDRPTVVLQRVRSDEDLWQLAKENASTVRAITEANDLDALPAPWEKLLLIPKAL